MQKTVRYTRTQLFELVWTTPLLTLAGEIGISDVALAKACRKVGIPLPGRGHWAKPPERRPKWPRLPKAEKPAYEEVSFDVLDPSAFRLARKPDVGPDVITVPDSLSDPSVLVTATKAARREDPISPVVVFRKGRALDIRASPQGFDRAMRIVDTLIKACESRGYRWKLTKEGKTVIQCLGHELEVSLAEKLSRHELPRRRVPPDPRNPWMSVLTSARTEYEYKPTGLFTFAVANPVNGLAQRSWSDTKTQRLEDKLGHIVAGLPVIVEGIKDLDREREERNKRYEEEQAKRHQAARSRESTRLLREELAGAVTAWKRAEEIRAFCDRLEGRAEAAGSEATEGCREWLTWAREQADLLDPSVGDVTALVSLAVDLPASFGGGHDYGQPSADWWTR